MTQGDQNCKLKRIDTSYAWNVCLTLVDNMKGHQSTQSNTIYTVFEKLICITRQNKNHESAPM